MCYFDCASIQLSANEQITLLTDSGAEYDVTRKEWGYYATPSLNGRLSGFQLRAVLVRSEVTGRYFVLIVESLKLQQFIDYIQLEQMVIVHWLDNSDSLDSLSQSLKMHS